MTIVQYPLEFSVESYSAWHESTTPNDAPLIEQVQNVRNELMTRCRGRLGCVADLLSRVAAHTEPECDIQTNGWLTGSYNPPIQLSDSATDDEYAQLFKPVSSIIEKMWRRNRDADENRRITVDNLDARMTDIVRTSIIAPTNFHARALAQRLNSWEAIVPATVRSTEFADIERVFVESEAKLDAGYFAYHALVKAKNLPALEVQIFSNLTDAWRHMSHKTYELSRIQTKLSKQEGDASVRLVSLGHTLRLVELEMERIALEMAKL